MANWKKVLVSGSDIEINEIQATGGITASGIDPGNTGGGSDHVLVINSDGHVLKRAQSDVQGVTTAIFTLTGSAGDTTASFDATGDALHLSSSNGDFTITVDSSSNANITSIDFNFKNAVVSGAAQIANAISGAFTQASSSLSASIGALYPLSASTGTNINTISSSLSASIGVLAVNSSSAGTNLNTISSSLSASIGALYPISSSTGTNINNVSASVVTLSSSVSTINVENDGFALSGSIIGTPNQIKLTADAGRVKQDADFTISSNVSDATADTVTINASTTNDGTGTGLTLNFTTTGGGAIDATSISVHTAGTGYEAGDVITIPAAQIPGTSTDVELDALTAAQITTTNKGFQIGLVDDVQITGSLIVSKSITADTLTLLGLSLVDNNAAVISGSNIFGSDAETDFHQFTGSVNFGGGITGSTIPTDNSRVVKDLLAVTSDGHFVKVGTNIHNAVSGAFTQASSSLSASIGVLAANSASAGTNLNTISSSLSASVGVVALGSASAGTNLNTISSSLSASIGVLAVGSASAGTNINTISSSLSASIGTLALGSASAGTNINTISSSLSASIGVLALGSASAGTNINTISSSLSASIGTVAAASSSVGTNINTISSSLSASIGAVALGSSSGGTLLNSVSGTATANSGALQNLGSITGDVTGSHVSMSVVGIQGVAISAQEATQIAEIGAHEISTTEWGYLANLNQSLTTDSNVEFADLTVDNLTVTSTVTSINTANLNVSDRFILLNSHSLAAEDAEWSPQDGGIVVQLSGSYQGAKVGTALYYDNTEERWALVGSASNASGDASGLAPDQLIVSVKTAAGLPGSNPVDFGNDADSWYGMMHIDTNNTDGDGNNIYIYA